MAELLQDEVKLKALFKTAFLEVLEERKDLLHDIIEETLEDVALARAIEAGQRTEDVSRREVLSALEGSHSRFASKRALPKTSAPWTINPSARDSKH